MNGRNSSHSARLARPDVSPPHEYASITLRHPPGARVGAAASTAVSIQSAAAVEARRFVARLLLNEVGGTTEQRFRWGPGDPVHP